MRGSLIAFAAASIVTLSGTAWAMSGQGGYLGLNPGAGLQPPEQQIGIPMSHQGGYLGLNPGAELHPLNLDTASDFKTTSGAWCAGSVEPTRCLKRAEVDHKYCVEHEQDHYATCRRALDFVAWSH
jgi:hypothetical protein